MPGVVGSLSIPAFTRVARATNLTVSNCDYVAIDWCEAL
jgi:hypothetical protein